MNEQEQFWAGDFGTTYRNNNKIFDHDLQIKAWNTMLRTIEANQLAKVLECGCNIGRNLSTLKRIAPAAKLSLIEINKESYDLAVKEIHPEYSFHGSLLQSNFANNLFDLAFTCGVLIHIPPYDLFKNIEKIYNYSRKYILLAEYFSRDYEMKLYHGQMNRLFKMDFGGYVLDNFNVDIVDYGFLWGREYDAGGFDDATWWLLEKKS